MPDGLNINDGVRVGRQEKKSTPIPIINYLMDFNVTFHEAIKSIGHQSICIYYISK